MASHDALTGLPNRLSFDQILMKLIEKEFLDGFKAINDTLGHDAAGQKLAMTPSIGISLYPQDGSVPDEPIKRADMAVYKVKQNG